MGGDVAGREAFRVERDHHLIQPRQPALPDRHRDRFEAAVAIPRDLHRDVADLGADRLGIVPVARVPRPAPVDRVRLVAEVIGDLGLERALQHLANQAGQQATFAGQRDTGRLGLFDQLISCRRQQAHRAATRAPPAGSPPRPRWWCSM